MTRDIETPNPDDLNQFPELGVLALLSAALRITRWSLSAQHPELLALERPYWCPVTSPEITDRARRILRLSIRLHEAVLAYCAAITPAPPPPPDDESALF